VLGDAQRARIGALGDFVGPLAIKAGAAYAAEQIIDALLDLLDARHARLERDAAAMADARATIEEFNARLLLTPRLVLHS